MIKTTRAATLFGSRSTETPSKNWLRQQPDMAGKHATAEAKGRFLAALEVSHGNVRTAANLASVGRRSVYRWFTADQSFRREMAIGYLMRPDEIQDAADVGLLLTLDIMNDRYAFGLLDEQAVRRPGINVTEWDLNTGRSCSGSSACWRWPTVR
jgi:hypothetical protein